MRLEATFMLLAAATVGFFTGALWTTEPLLSLIAALFLSVPILYLTERINNWAFEQRMRERLRR